MKQDILEQAIFNKYSMNHLVKDTSYKFKFKNAQINKKHENKVVLDGNITCTVFYNEFSPVYNRESYFSYDNGKEVLYVSNTPILPADAFECHISIYDEENGGFALNVFLNEKYSFTPRTNVVEDYIKQENVAGLNNLFEENGLELFEEMECMFSIDLSSEKRFKNFAEFEKEVKSLINKFGMEYDQEEEDSSYEELEFETKKKFLKFANKLSKDEFNDFLRSEYE